jgi:hypothetical protein
VLEKRILVARRGLFPINGITFNGESKLIRKATGYEKKPTPHRHRVRWLREATLPAPFDRISDPQIPPTRHEYQPRPPLKIPISVLAGRLDKYATSDSVRDWRKETTHACDVRWFAGGHFFINQERTAILEYLSSELIDLQSEWTPERIERIA